MEQMTNNPDNAGTPAENNAQDPRSLWRTITDPSTGQETVTNAAEDPWDLDVILTLPDGASPVEPGPELLGIYTAMVIGARSQDHDLNISQDTFQIVGHFWKARLPERT